MDRRKKNKLVRARKSALYDGLKGAHKGGARADLFKAHVKRLVKAATKPAKTTT